MASRIEEAVEKLTSELLEEMPGIELVDVEYVKERDWCLRIFIDKEGGIEIDDCQKLSELLGKALDERDIIPGSYLLEVSSPGLDRPLKKDKDFNREMGKKVDISLYEPLNGEKSLTGVLSGYDGKTLSIDGGEPIPMGKISLVRLHIDF